MITEEQIPEIVKSINIPKTNLPVGVIPVRISRFVRKYSHVYFEGLGLYDVNNEDEPIRLMTEEEANFIINYGT